MDPQTPPKPVPQAMPAAPPAPEPITPPPTTVPGPTPPPVSLPRKEAGPIDYAEADKVAQAEGDEYWQQFAREIELEKEIAEMGGVEKIERGEVPIPEAIAKEMGIKPAVTLETPIQKVSDFAVRGVTLSDDQLSAGVKKPPSTGFRWLVEWFILQMKKAGYVLKKIKGQLIREQPQAAH